MNWKNCYKKFLIFIFLFTFQINSQDCIICLSELNLVSTKLPCTHIYCTTCLDSWVQTHLHSTCPTCRFYIGNQGAYELYKQFLISLQNKELSVIIDQADRLYIQKATYLHHIKSNIKLGILENNDVNRQLVEGLESSAKKWGHYLTRNIRTLIRHKYDAFLVKKRNTPILPYSIKNIALKRLNFLKETYFNLYNSRYIKNNRQTKMLICTLLQHCIQYITNKQVLRDCIDYFKENKLHLNIITKQYLGIYS
ncbi:MAG: RING finger domain-containing protein [Candidatus Babeliales bacterium]|nr:RING finger domain-containing protein [Candidatus Babeliales bacterium]